MHSKLFASAAVLCAVPAVYICAANAISENVVIDHNFLVGGCWAALVSLIFGCATLMSVAVDIYMAEDDGDTDRA